MKRHDPLTNRNILLSAGIVIVAALLVCQLFMVQIVHGDEYVRLGNRQFVQASAGLYDRGTIFFTTKDGETVPAATIKSTFVVAIDPTNIGDAEQIYISLSEVVDVNRDRFMSSAAKRDDPYEEVATGLSDEQANSVRALGMPGVAVYQVNSRSYPLHERAAQVVGLMAKSKEDGDTSRGRYGIERQYEDTLLRDPKSLYQNFFSGIISGTLNAISGEPSQFTEGDVVLTIEPTVQSELEKQVKNVADVWKSKSVGGIVMEPVTGRIIAMAGYPTFDPNDPSSGSLASFKNPLVENVYEMGSIVKPLTMAAALDEGVLTATTTYHDEGFRVLDGRRIENFDGKGRGTVTMQEVLNQSLNTGAIFAMEKLGVDRFRAKMKNYGFGEKTGIDLPGDNLGLTKNFASEREVEHATIAYGHGFAVSPLAITRSLAALANGGLLVTPHVVERIDYRMGMTQKNDLPEAKRILKESTSREISKMLTEVVDKALLGGKYRSSTITVAAKTGTAFLVSPSGGYYKDRYLHSFFGYFPATNARFIVFLYNYDPTGAQYASATLTEPFMNLEKFLVNYYEIPPDRQKEAVTNEVNN